MEIFRAEDGSSMVLRNDDSYLQVHTALTVLCRCEKSRIFYRLRVFQNWVLRRIAGQVAGENPEVKSS
jgi:hypothetical protein